MKPRILVVEDEPAIADTIVYALSTDGFEPHWCAIGGAALEAARSQPCPTISVDWIVNNSPFAGREGKFVTSRQVRDRLYKELEKNVALRVEPTESPDTHSVSGRGELHLGILMETMRREGYEFQVSRPRVITREGPGGERQEPYEELMIDVPEEYMGVVMEKLGPRRAEMSEMRNPGQGTVRLTFRIPARGLFGYRSEYLTDTRGTGIMHHRFLDYGPWAGPLTGRKRGVLVADRAFQQVMTNRISQFFAVDSQKVPNQGPWHRQVERFEPIVCAQDRLRAAK